jgi:membrane protein
MPWNIRTSSSPRQKVGQMKEIVRRRYEPVDARLRSWPTRLWRTWQNYQHHGGATTAAALAYHIFFSLFPLLLLLSALGSRLLEDEAIQSTLVITLQQLLPGTADFVYQTVKELTMQRQAAGVIGGLSLVWSASAMFKVIIGALDRIFGVRSGYVRIFIAMLLVLLVAALFILAAGVSAASGFLSRILVESQQPFGSLGGIALGVQALSLGIAIGAFLIVYKFLPSCEVLWRAAFTAAIPVGIIWKIAQQLFVLYLTDVANFSPIYGPLTAVVALLLWAYISSSIFLLGVELVAILNSEAAASRGEELCKPS